MRGESSTFSAGQLGPQILGLVLLAAVEFTQVLFLGLVHNSHDTGNRLAHCVAVKIKVLHYSHVMISTLLGNL